MIKKLLKEWDYELNIIKPDEISLNSHKKVYWKCNKGHSWLTTIYNRVAGKNCPYCSNQRILKGFNDLLSTYPDICKEWNYELNFKEYGLKPDEVVFGSAKKVYWKCKNNHEWITTIVSRTKLNSNCPYCSNQKVLKGYNDLLSRFPNLTMEWDYELNIIKPDEVVFGSNKKVWWKCSQGHSYQKAISYRIMQKYGCPFCTGKKVLSGFNDLQTLFPDIAKEYSDKNKLPANQISGGSRKKVYWKCSQGHTWITAIYNRTWKHKTGCPYCNDKGTSKHEQILFNELNHIYQCENRKKHKINGKFYETDIFIPKLNLGIEFNGLYWHRDKQEYDNLKEKALSTKMKMFYVMEGTENKIIDNKIYFDCKHKYEDNFTWAKNQLKEMIKTQ